MKLTEIMRLNRTPREMAMALALGIFVGLTPYVGFHTLLVVGLAAVLRLPLVVAYFASHILNPLTLPLYFPLAAKAGEYIMGREISLIFDWQHITLSSLLAAGQEIFWPFFVGTNLIAFIGALLTYLLSYPLFHLYRKKQLPHE